MSILQRLIRRVRVSATGDDTKQSPVQQVAYLGKVGDAYVLFPFGLHGNADVDTSALMFDTQGARVIIAGAPPGRPQMAAGEVCLYHPSTRSLVHMKADGSIDMTAPEIVINGNLTVSGTVTNAGIDVGSTHTHIGSPTAPTGAISPTGVPV